MILALKPLGYIADTIFVTDIGGSPGYGSGVQGRGGKSKSWEFPLKQDEPLYFTTKLVTRVYSTHHFAPGVVTYNNGHCSVVLRQVLFEA